MSPQSSAVYAALVVEGAASAAAPLTDALAAGGFRVLSCRDGVQALQMLERERPDVVLFDEGLAGEEALGACAALHRRNPHGGPPLLMVVSTHSPGSVDAAFEAGATDIVATPVNATALIRRCRRLVEAQRREVESSLNEARLEVMLGSADEAMLTVDLAGRVRFANKAALELFRPTSGELVMRAARDILEGSSTEDFDLRTESHRELVGVREDGSRFVADVSLARFLSGAAVRYAVLVRDVTERRMIERRLRLLEAALENAQDGVAVGIVGANCETLSLTYVNPALARLAGRAVQGCVGQSLEDVLGLRLDPAARAEFVRGGPLVAGDSTQLVGRRSDGSTYALELRVSMIADAADNAFVATARDVTTRNRREEALREAQKMESIGVLAGGVAHDFNNLLTVILGQAQLVRATLAEGSPQRPRLDAVLASARHAAHLTSQLLAYAGQRPHRPNVVSLNDLLRGSRSLLRAMAPQGIAMDFDCEAELPTTEGDRAQLQQLLMNLVLNARDAIVARGSEPAEAQGHIRAGTFLCRLTEETLCAGHVRLPAGDYVGLRVSDDGIGIPKGALPRLFEPFFSTKGSGRGLGLAAVAGILRIHKGGMRVETHAGPGATFEVLLPVSARFERGVRPPALSPSGGAPARKGLAVLLIDDEPLVLDYMADTLSLAGYVVHKASSGESGLALLSRELENIALIITDLSMPSMNGREVLRRAREMCPRLPGILVSGFEEADRPASDADEQGRGPKFLAKPFVGEDLLGAVAELLDDSAQP